MTLQVICDKPMFIKCIYVMLNYIVYSPILYRLRSRFSIMCCHYLFTY